MGDLRSAFDSCSRRNRPSRRNAAVCRATAAENSRPLWVTCSINCALAPGSRVSSTSTVPSLGASNGPTSRPSPTPCSRDHAQVARSAPTPLARLEQHSLAVRAQQLPAVRQPRQTRAARLPRTGEPSSTMRPGGSAGRPRAGRSPRLRVRRIPESPHRPCCGRPGARYRRASAPESPPARAHWPRDPPSRKNR